MDIFVLMPVRSIKCFQNLEMNNLSLSQIISLGSLKECVGIPQKKEAYIESAHAEKAMRSLKDRSDVKQQKSDQTGD